jgi:electron transfer flavoprotein alpha subunit
MSKILVVAEHQDGTLKKSTLTTLNMARKLAEKNGGDIDLLVLGSDVGGIASALTGYGAGTVYVADHAELADPLAGPFAKVIADVAEEIDAGVVACSASTFGKDVMPRVAARLDAGMASDIVDVVDTSEGTGYRRPMWAGNILADVVIDTDIHVITARSSAFDAAESAGGESAVESVDAAPELGAARARYVKFDATESDRPDLTEAEVVVSGGRGLKSEEGFNEVMNPLADALGAAIGASRAAVDDGYAPNDYQIGQTGKVVAPQLYIAVAISGAIQHLAGMKNSKTIVAINTRDDEPIFKVADYGLVGDAFKVIPELVAKVKAYKG